MHKILVIKPPYDYKGTPKDVEVLMESLKKVLRWQTFTLDINMYNRKIFFSSRVEEKLADVLEGQIYSIWPEAEVHYVDEYLPNNIEQCAYGTMYMENGDLLPCKDHTEFNTLTLANFYSVLNKLKPHEGIFYQVVIHPIASDAFQVRAQRAAQLKAKQAGDKLRLIKKFVDLKYSGANLKEGYLQAEAKNKEELYRCEVRMIGFAKDFEAAKNKISNAGLTFANFENNINQPHFKVTKLTEQLRKDFIAPKKKPSLVLTGREIATYFHIPQEGDQVPNIFKVLSKKAEPPLELPTSANTKPGEISLFARTNFRDIKDEFGITYKDRERHMYVVGKSGSGKSKMLEMLINADIAQGKGVCVLDPHGDLVDNVMKYIPEHRIKDVILFDPADTEFPIAFNPLEHVDYEYRQQVTTGFIGIFRKLFGANWTPRLEHVMRFVVLALLDTPKATPMSILKLLTDRNFRQEVIPQIEDSVVKNFWTNEFASWSEKFDSEAIMPILNKIGQFLSNTQIRNIVCQQINKVDLKDIMNNEKVLLIKVSKGILGEENSELVGSMVITKVYQAAMMRASIAEEDRKPFYFYVDEFQNFATDTFGEILSEARKYKLSLTIAHQFMGQLLPSIRSTVFGNIGTMVSFRVGMDDAPYLAKEFSPIFTDHDIVNLGVQEIYLKMSIHGNIKDAFSARTLRIPNPPARNFVREIVEHTRKHYCQTKQEVLDEIEGKEEGAMALINELQDADFEAPII